MNDVSLRHRRFRAATALLVALLPIAALADSCTSTDRPARTPQIVAVSEAAR